MVAKAEPNVVPLCDVLLVLLIIFMVITPSVQRGMDVRLPETTSDSSATPAGVIVMTLHKNGKVDLNGQYYEIELLRSALEGIYAPRQDKTIFIRAEAGRPLRRVIDIIDIARGAGVEVLGIIPEYFEEEDIQ